MIFHRRLTNRMELGNSFLHLPAHCRGGCQARSARCFALMDGIEKCLKTSSCRALNALKGKIVKKWRIWGLMDGLCAFLLAGIVDFQCFYRLLSPWLSWVILSSRMKKVCKKIMAAGKITKKQLSALKISKAALPRWPAQAQTAKLSSRAAYCFSIRDFSKGRGSGSRGQMVLYWQQYPIRKLHIQLLIHILQFNCCFPYHPRFRYRSNEEEGARRSLASFVRLLLSSADMNVMSVRLL
jgi:hypothetical protein